MAPTYDRRVSIMNTLANIDYLNGNRSNKTQAGNENYEVPFAC